ncbi:hypothetical protein KC363_g170 [Hortaea werneckii]|nr:hypothetical protein KC363_g170 [Hortaea werneckii]
MSRPRPADMPHVAKRPRVGDRTMLACIGCKSRKLKCDGHVPKCQNCLKSERGCRGPRDRSGHLLAPPERLHAKSRKPSGVFGDLTPAGQT